MATLTNQPIKDTYAGLIKTLDNLALDPTVVKQLTDGVGNNLPMLASQIGISYTGTQDFSSATIIGMLPAGLIPGSAANSMVSAASLTTTGAIVKGDGDIVLGDGAKVYNTAATDTRPYDGRSVVLGVGANVDKTTDHSFVTSYVGGIAIGDNATAKLVSKYCPISIGKDSSSSESGVAIGYSADSTTGIAIGDNATAASAILGADSISIGTNSKSMGYSSVSLGHGSQSGVGTGGAYGSGSVAVGFNAKANILNGVAIGPLTQATAVGASAIGAGVIAATVDTVTVKKLQMLDYATINYADDTAAATGGIPLGGVYHTAGVLKIRIA
jgi:hypothetical protein